MSNLPPLPKELHNDKPTVTLSHQQLYDWGMAVREAALEDAAVKCIELMKQYRSTSTRTKDLATSA